MVMEDRELARALVAAGEVGSQTSDHAPLGGLTFRDQAVRLARSWAEIRGWTGIAPAGLRPPEESFDDNTLRAWREAGGRYILATNQSRSAGPEIYGSGTDALVLIPRLMKDDYNVFVQEGGLRADRLTEAFLEGTRKLRAIGGVAVVATHTQIMGTDRRLDALRVLADTVKAQGDWWFAEGREVARWWSLRADTRVGFQAGAGEVADTVASLVAGPPALATAIPAILVEAPDAEPISGLWINIVLPLGSQGIVPLVDGTPVPFATTTWGIRVPLGDLPPGGTRVITLAADLEAAPAGG
jgi:peptidoglycan/xylan/chitin deacetylase (PgdA/CDA1 family)